MIKIVKKSLLCILCIAVLFAFAPMMTGVSDVAMAKSKAQNKKQYKLVKTTKEYFYDKKKKKWVVRNVVNFSYNKYGDPIKRVVHVYIDGKKNGKPAVYKYLYTYKKGKKTKMIEKPPYNNPNSKSKSIYYYNKKGLVTKWKSEGVTETAPLLGEVPIMDSFKQTTTYKYNKHNHIIKQVMKSHSESKSKKDGTLVDKHDSSFASKNVLKYKKGIIVSGKYYVKMGKKYKLATPFTFTKEGFMKVSNNKSSTCKYTIKNGIVKQFIEVRKYSEDEVYKSKYVLTYTKKKTNAETYRAMINDISTIAGYSQLIRAWFGPRIY